MHNLIPTKILYVLFLLITSGVAYGCQNGNWTYSYISMSTNSTSKVSIKRFTDAVYARGEDSSGIKEMYQLGDGLVLYRGLTSDEVNGISPFFMMDMPANVVLSLLAHQFKQPCTINGSNIQFSYDLPAENNLDMGLANVTGNVSRISDTAIIYELNVAGSTTFKISGEINFSAIGQLPTDTEIPDWVITRGSGANPNKVIKPNKAIHTVNDLKYLDY